jgi:uncharacterized protein (DUF362 family)
MKRINRREFLRIVSTGLSALAISPLYSACNRAGIVEDTPAHNTSTAVPSSTPIPSENTQSIVQIPTTPTPTLPLPSSTPYPPDIAVARGGDPETMVRRVIASLGGMNRFVPSGANVIIKPNICVAYHTYEYAATTNPWVVAALVKMVLEAGAKSVKVMDYPFGGSAQEAYSISGIQEQVLAAGGEMIPISSIKFIPTTLPNGQALKNCKIFDDVLKADVLINVPIAKDHGLALLTLGMKNLMGVIHDRPALHGNLGQNLADLGAFLRPSLTVIDGVRILTANGPTGGNLDNVRQKDTIIASMDIVAADSYAAKTLFDFPPENLTYIQAGVKNGLGRSDLENMKVEEINVAG